MRAENPTPKNAPSMKFFEGFAWAVPEAFSAALSNCRFEEGDILYDNPGAYVVSWAESRKHISRYIQITFPPRATGTGSGQVFERNWQTEVRFDLFDSAGKRRRLKATQGGLYTALWNGDFDELQPDPAEPLGIRSIPRDAISLESLGALAPAPPFFVMAVDQASELLRTKKSQIQIALKSHLAFEPKLIELREIGLKNWGRFAPTIELFLFATEGIPARKLHDLVKAVVYKPAKDSKTDRFRIQAHGWLFER